jgi:hypothetical protein
MLMKELTVEYVTPHLMQEMSKRKEKKPRGDDSATVSCQIKADDPPSRQGEGCGSIMANRGILHDFATK